MDWPLEMWIERAQARRRDPRGRIIDLVGFGKLKPEQAEAWARDHGLPPFAAEPAAGTFDPIQERLWSLPMAVAWMIWRTPEAVRRCWHEFRTECWDWQCRSTRLPRPKWPGGWRTYNGHDLRQRDSLSPAGVLTLARFPGGSRVVLDPENAKRELIGALCDGRLIARATVARIDIPAREWIDMSPFTEPAGKAMHDALFVAGERAPKFAGVRVERAAVVALWPVQKPVKPEGKKRGPAPKKTEQTRLRMLADLRDGSLSRDEKQDAMAKRYGVSRDTCRTALREALSELETPTNSDTN